jgi:hypothetical protein
VDKSRPFFGYFYNFLKTGERILQPKRRKFAQSGHPAWQPCSNAWKVFFSIASFVDFQTPSVKPCFSDLWQNEVVEGVTEEPAPHHNPISQTNADCK